MPRHRSFLIVSAVPAVALLVAVLRVRLTAGVLIAADGIVALAAIRAGRFADEPRVDELHAGKVRVAERGHDLEQVVLFGEFRRGAFSKFVVDGLIRVERRDVHLEVAPPVALLLRVQERAVQEPFEKRLVDVDEFEPAELSERRQKQLALHLLDLVKARHVPADDIVCHQRDAVVVAARAIVEVFCPAEVCAPVGEKFGVFLLHALPDRFAPVRWIMPGDLLPDLLLAGL